MIGAKKVETKGLSALEALAGFKKSILEDLNLAGAAGVTKQEINWNAIRTARESQAQQRLNAEKYRAMARI